MNPIEKNKKQRQERIGIKSVNRNGSVMTIIEYTKATNIVVIFDNGYRTKTTWNAFKLKNVKNPYDKTIYGVGFLGEGDYKSKHEGKITKQYDAWNSMMTRAYSTKLHSKHSTYEGCSVAEEWHNFQNFAKWFDDNFYTVNTERMNLDKDILSKGNKEYSPSTCVFTPARINTLFIKVDKARGSQPVGVSYRSCTGKYQAMVNKDSKGVFLGVYATKEEAFAVYKVAKEEYIKKVADEYKGIIPDELYKAMMNYEISIDD